jgi:hypothetical protein
VLKGDIVIATGVKTRPLKPYESPKIEIHSKKEFQNQISLLKRSLCPENELRSYETVLTAQVHLLEKMFVPRLGNVIHLEPDVPI